MNRCERIRRVLREGPSTSDEIAAELRFAKRDIFAGLSTLRTLGHIKAVGEVREGRKLWKIYTLTPRAENLRSKQPGRNQ